MSWLWKVLQGDKTKLEIEEFRELNSNFQSLAESANSLARHCYSMKTLKASGNAITPVLGQFERELGHFEIRLKHALRIEGEIKREEKKARQKAGTKAAKGVRIDEYSERRGHPTISWLLNLLQHRNKEQLEIEELQTLIDEFETLAERAVNLAGQCLKLADAKQDDGVIKEQVMDIFDRNLRIFESELNRALGIKRSIKTAEQVYATRIITPIEVKISHYVGKGDLIIGSNPASKNCVLIESEGINDNHCRIKVLRLPEEGKTYRLRVTAGGFIHILPYGRILSPGKYFDFELGDWASMLLYMDLARIKSNMPAMATVNLKP